MFINVSSESSNTEIKTVDSSDVVGSSLRGGLDMDVVAGAIKFWDLFAPVLSESDQAFNEQKRFFEAIPPLLLEEYRGRFVASRNGEIVDSDDDFVNLTHRFFQNAGNVPVYMTKIGEDEGIFIETPFSD